MGIGRDIAYGLGAAATAPLWGISLLKTGKWRTDWPGRFGCAAAAPQDASGRKRLLIHGVSVGEINAIRGLVDRLAAAGDLDLVIASTTNTGFARATALFAPQHRVVRFPLDFSAAVGRFLHAVQPDAVALVELEVWPNFVEACTRRNVPVAVINGRLTARSFKGYHRIAPLIRPSFAALAAAGVQTADYAERFIALGVPEGRVRVLDTMKWDNAVIADTVPGDASLGRALGIDRSRPLVVAGSTAPGEEKLLLDALPPQVQLLVAPRKPEWFDAVMQAAPDAVRRTEYPDDQPRDMQAVQSSAGGAGAGAGGASGGRPRVFLLDTIGELKQAYALADVCVVGRSFMGDLYGSDMMEPIALGKPTVIGPHFADFADTMEALQAAGGIVVAKQPGPAVMELLADAEKAAKIAAAGRSVILSRQGATARYAALLRELLGLSATP